MFTDLNENTYSDAIKFVTEAGIMKGYFDGSFRPNETVTVAEFCKMIYLMIPIRSLDYANHDIKEQMETLDLFEDEWFDKYILFIQKLIAFKGEFETKNEIREIISKPNKNITSNESYIIMRFVFEFIIPNSLIYEITDEITNEVNLRRAECALLFYKFVVFWFEKVISVKNHHERKSLITLWSKSPFSPFIFTDYFIKNVPTLKYKIEDKTFIYIFVYFIYKNLKDIEYIYNRISEIDEYVLKHLAYAENKYGYQYTSLTSLYNMLSNSNKSYKFNIPKISLHMSNVIYLNDPQEGRLYDNLIDKELDNKEAKDNNKNETNIETKNAYILCLSEDDEERLPMWIQYADGARGCRIEFEIPKKIDMYKINYNYSENNIPNIIEILINQINKERKSLLLGVGDYSIISYISDRIHEVQYYYKDKYYEHEKEIRYIVNAFPEDAEQYDFIREGEYFPRLYCETPYPFPIKSVMLGPKCPNPEQVALYLKRMGVPEVLKSNIKFQ